MLCLAGKGITLKKIPEKQRTKLSDCKDWGWDPKKAKQDFSVEPNSVASLRYVHCTFHFAPPHWLQAAAAGPSARFSA